MRGPLRASLERMLPRLQAEEELRLASTLLVGTNQLKKRDAEQWRKARLKELGVETVKRPASLKEHIQNLASRGFNVVVDGKPAEVDAS